MSEYIIQGTGSYESIPVVNAGYPPDYSKVQMIPISVEYGTLNEPVRIWQSGSAFMDASYYQDTQGGRHWRIKWCTLPGWPGANTDPDSPNVTDLSGEMDTLYIGAVYSQDGDNPATSIMSWNENESFPYQNGILYNGAFDNMGAVIGGDWDETPVPSDYEDPSRTSPQGGEFADREEFGQTDDIDIPMEAQEITLSGFITMYSLGQGDVANLGAAIFTNDTWTNLRNKFNGVGDPISYIISAVEIPVPPSTDNSKNFNLGGVEIENNSGNPLPIHCTNFRYRNLAFGSVTLKETWGTEKDYSQTSVSIYLPYVGVKDLDAEMVVNSKLTLKGCIDISNGDLFYALIVNKSDRPGVYIGSSGVAYRFQGNAGRQIPVGRADNTGQLAAMFGGMASMGVGLVSGNPMMAVGGAAGIIGGAAMGQKVSMASGAGGSIGRADVQYPYLIITRKVPVYPNEWRAHFGATRYQTFTVSDVHGYTQFADYHADQIEGANDAERAAIEQAMKAGVFLP